MALTSVAAHPGVPPCNYVAGQNGGIKWNIIDK